MRKGSVVAAFSIALSVMMASIALMVPPAAWAENGEGYGSVSVSSTAESLTIGNRALSRTFRLTGGKLKTTKLVNGLGATEIIPGADSEEFVIDGMLEAKRLEPQTPLTSVKPRPGTATEVSAVSVMPNEPAAAINAIDGDPTTYWSSAEVADGHPYFDIDFHTEKQIKTLAITPRVYNGSYECTGQILALTLQRWTGSAWEDVQAFTLPGGVQAGAQTLTLTSDLSAAKIRLLVTDSHFWEAAKKGRFANIAELDIRDAEGRSVIERADTSGMWTAQVSSSSTQGGDAGGAPALLDGDPNTFWHSNYGQGDGPANQLPVIAMIDRKSATDSFQTFGYLPRPNPNNGNWLEFELRAADDPDQLERESSRLTAPDGSTTFRVSYVGMYGTGEAAGSKWCYFALSKPCTKRYIAAVVTKGQGGPFAAGAGIDLFREAFTSVPTTNQPQIKTSELTLAGAPKTEETSATIKGVNKTGKLVSFTFEPVQFGSGQATVTEKVVMYDGDHFMRKWIEVKSEDEDIRFNYIDGEHLDLSGVDAAHRWTIPTNAGGVVQMDMEKSILGQPIYANGMFLGSEFPAADTQIEDTLGRARYWCGKNFKDFRRDHEATYTGLNDQGAYVSWQTVCGATHASSLDMNVIQIDFFSYIKSISEPSEFRIQYNSWFDNMMRINNENILESFHEIDKHFSATGVRPLDNYVVDDGWNQYRSSAGAMSSGIDIERNGPVEESNKSGFWEINSKFGYTLDDSAKLVKKLGSSFGVWIGPRGGYNYYSTLADIIARANKGSKAGNSIDVADTRYVKNFEHFAIDMMEKYGVSYWKWDGFADQAQFGAFRVGEGVAGYDEAHQHMYGGPHGYFHVTDLWEKWCRLLSNVQHRADELHLPAFWISLTCYVNPSPWYLQFSNSIWMQCNADRGERYNTGEFTDKMNSMLTYRDGVYYDFIKNHEFQFPLANIYNHDPIYGKEDTGISASSMTGEQFRNYLFMQGTRGTAFWELYYSASIFDTEKYLVNADFLKWEEENFSMLRNAKVIGGTPAKTATLAGSNGLGGARSARTGEQHAYGFACFNDAGDEGIISMRNPAHAEKTISFRLDAGVGCTTAGTYHVVLDHGYAEAGARLTAAPATIAQGHEVQMTLQPGETQIWHLSRKGDTNAPTLVSQEQLSDTVLRVQTSEHVSGATFEVTVDGTSAELKSAHAYADLKTFDLELASAPAHGERISVSATAGSDSAGNRLAGSFERRFHTGGVVYAFDAASAAGAGEVAGLEGAVGFTATASVDEVVPNTVFMHQGEEWSLALDGDGRAVFTVNGVSAVSEQAVGGLTTIAGVRENNGMLKIYVGGEIAGSAYRADKVRDHSLAAATISCAGSPSVASARVFDRALGYDEVPTSPLADLIKQVEGMRDHSSKASWTATSADAVLAEASFALAKNTEDQQAAYQKLLAVLRGLVPGTDNVETKNLAAALEPTAAWLPGSTTDPSLIYNAGSPLSKVCDGDTSSESRFGIFGNDAHRQPAYLQIDLGHACTIDAVKLWRYWGGSRMYDATALVVSSTPDFADKQVLYYSGATDVFKLGEQPTATLYHESPDGKVIFGVEPQAQAGSQAQAQPQPQAITAASRQRRSLAAGESAPVEARYVRLYMNGYEGGIGKENHVVELQILGKRKIELGDVYGVEALKAQIAAAKEALKNRDTYTEDTVAALESALKAAEQMVDTLAKQHDAGAYTTTRGEFDDVSAALAQALAGLKPKQPSELVQVTFDYGHDDMVQTVSVASGSTLTEPEKPVRKSYTFEGWMTDAGTAYDFSVAVTQDLKLTASWKPEATSDNTTDDDPSGDPNKKPDDGTSNDPDKKPGSDPSNDPNKKPGSDPSNDPNKKPDKNTDEGSGNGSDNGSGNGSGNKQGSGHSRSRALPRTGDMALLVVGTSGLAGVSACVLAVVRKRRHE
ncbi:discoidin domain-containing protein [Collinsella sp. AGMB00827]|uniref:Discoidin domain-containing protein n=1 Tax=Collinsella ureilytica TaxID=2869515 RepID=A0ABS7MIW3_9ACTN|nr:discoidin domain-containing protein [Collinsella urealyticum]MBY4797304.1 discoidin domain-containing protein [Collinsella urealyticum]